MSIELKEAREASKGAFDPAILQQNFYNNQIPRQRTNEMLKVIEREKILSRRYRRIELSREDQYRYSFRVVAKLLELSKKHNWSDKELYWSMSFIYGDYFPTTLHNSAFKYVIQVAGSEEQSKKWIPLCDTHEVIGCYAQTELGHGSNVRRLQTKAYYDPVSKNLVMCSNDDITSRKWWIGGLGVGADHAAIQALLYFPPANDPNCTDRSKYVDLGPHLFIVPIRDPKTRAPFPGVTVGDIGPKAAHGFSLIDNGFVEFDNVEIPADYLLNRFTKIDTSGPHAKYVVSGNPKVMYASMTNLRSGYPMLLGAYLSKASTIAARYLTVRRQFQETVTGPEGKPTLTKQEVQVVKYSSVYNRLVPIIALAYSTGFLSEAVLDKYNVMISSLVDHGDDTLLPEVHNLTSSLKGVISTHAVRAIEQAQILLGGHGYSYHSGIPVLYGNSLPTQTFEGENYVVAQQTSNTLTKLLRLILTEGKDVARKKLFPSAQFLIDTIDKVGTSREQGDSPRTADQWLSNDEYLISIFELRTAVLVNELSSLQDSTPETELKHLSYDVSMAFGEQFFVSSYLRGAAKIGEGARDISRRLARITTLTFILNSVPTLIEHSIIQGYSIGPLKAALRSEIAKVAPHVVALTDAFGHSDYELESALGNYDGEPYKHMVYRANQSSLNHADFIRELQLVKKAGQVPRPKI